MELVTVGTGTVAPSARRTCPCHWVARGDLRMLLDCGAGSLHRLAEFGLPWHQVTHVILTHFHPDHWGELPMLVYALKYTTEPPRREPLVILGPPGVVQLLRTLAEGYGDWLLDPGFPIGILDVRDAEPFPLNADVNLETFPVPHGTGGTPRLHRRHRAEQRAGAVGERVRRAALGMFLAGRAGDGYPPDAPTGWGSGQGSGSEALSLDALLSSCRNFGPGENRGHALWRPGVGGERWRSLHYWRWETLVVLIVMRHGATPDEVQKVISVIEEMGYQAQPMPGNQRTAVGLVGNDGRVDASRLEGLPGVHEVIHVSQPYKQVSREWKADPTIVRLPGGVAFGGTEVVAIAGPCSVETERQIIEAARQVKEAGAVVLRGGAWKPRSSPYSFQGLGKPALRLLAKARDETGLLICTEAMDESGLGWVAEMADIVQIGARNMQNFSLLKIAGRCGKPVLLKRGISATVQELLLSAEYLLAEGNHDVILCERGVRSFDTATRNLFDLTAIPVVHKLSHLPIIADPSHGTGLRDKVIPMARAAIAAGADGIMVEVHPNPEEALSDGAQSLFPDQFAQLMREVRAIAEVIGRRVAEPAMVGL